METNSTNPSHYKDKCSLECIETMIMAFGADKVYNFCICNAWKYMWRWKNKNGAEDISKARWYVEKAKELGFDGKNEIDNIECILEKIEKEVASEIK